MKRILIMAAVVFYTLCIFTACSKQPGTNPGTSNTTGSAKEVLFKKEALPRIDGSTANIPMASLMLQRVTGLSEAEVEPFVGFSTTPNAYLNLINRETDLLLVYEADDSIKRQIAESKVELEYYPIGKDALVFITNQSNPVVSLTTKQIQDIYQGKTKNWKEVGGKDITVKAYQRTKTSGSQALMMKLVMKDIKPMQAPAEHYPSEMGGLIDVLAQYNNSGNAIGYSVFYYANYMYEKPGLKFLSVDGVVPSNDSIRSGEYPFTNAFFAVIRKDEPQDSNSRKLLNWITSDEGKQSIKDAGYVND